ncbi:MAG: 3-oxoacyl-ACP synthase [Bacteroidota bacterium]
MILTLLLKEQIILHLQQLIQNKIEAIQSNQNSINESRLNETKSSAGDKYETGPAMLQQEEDKNKMQLQNALDLNEVLSKLNTEKIHDKVDLGSLVVSNLATYFFSIGLGKIEINNAAIYCISLQSPIGIALQNKKVGDKVIFQNNEIVLKEIL